MSDPRLTLAREGLAADWLEGRVAAERYGPVEVHMTRGLAPIREAPHPRAEQSDELLFGEAFAALERQDGWVFGQALRDGYVGWLEAELLAGPPPVPTHRVAAPATVALNGPSARAAGLLTLPLNALVRVGAEAAGFASAAGAGWIPAGHLAPIGRFEDDPAGVAERFLGAPYLWGGRTAAGIDCSGLVQQAMLACGRACPRDSDQQAALGYPVQPAALRRNDLVCWRGHVGIMLDGARLLHASGRRMAVVIEPLEAAVADRMEEMGPPVAWRRAI